MNTASERKLGKDRYSITMTLSVHQLSKQLIEVKVIEIISMRLCLTTLFGKSTQWVIWCRSCCIQ